MAERFGADRMGLATYMGDLLSQAVRELSGVAPGELFERFVLWTG